MLYKMSSHASKERYERLLYIATEIGLGEKIICSTAGHTEEKKEALTDTGIVLILSNDNLIITAYIATMGKATAMWRAVNSKKEMPTSFYNTVMANERKYKELKEIDDIFGYHKKDGKYTFYRKK